MITVIVPTFDEFNRYAFIKYVEVEIKDIPDFQDVNAIGRHLPGTPQGGVGPKPLQDLLDSGSKPVSSFYDRRQNTRMLKGYSVTIKVN